MILKLYTRTKKVNEDKDEGKFEIWPTREVRFVLGCSSFLVKKVSEQMDVVNALLVAVYPFGGSR